MIPYKKVILSVFPKWGNRLTTAGPLVDYKNHPWWDVTQMKIDASAINGRHIFIKGGADAQTMSYQVSIHCKFKGLRQGQIYHV